MIKARTGVTLTRSISVQLKLSCNHDHVSLLPCARVHCPEISRISHQCPQCSPCPPPWHAFRTQGGTLHVPGRSLMTTLGPIAAAHSCGSVCRCGCRCVKVAGGGGDACRGRVEICHLWRGRTGMRARVWVETGQGTCEKQGSDVSKGGQSVIWHL